MAELNYTPCKYNNLVECPAAGRSCWRCGWNPKVKNERLVRLLKGKPALASEKEDEE